LRHPLCWRQMLRTFTCDASVIVEPLLLFVPMETAQSWSTHVLYLVSLEI